jgi:hypothetical protein
MRVIICESISELKEAVKDRNDISYIEVLHGDMGSKCAYVINIETKKAGKK